MESDDSRFVRPDLIGRVRRVLTLLVLSKDLDDFVADAARGWRIHRLTGDRKQVWSVSVSANWRITFEEADGYIDRLNLEDYH